MTNLMKTDFNNLTNARLEWDRARCQDEEETYGSFGWNWDLTLKYDQ